MNATTLDTLQAVRYDPDALGQWLDGQALGDVVDLVADGHLSVEAIGAVREVAVRPALAEQVIEVLRDRRDRAAEAARLDALPDGVAIVPVLAGIDNPAAAVASLGLDDAVPFDVDDGYLYVGADVDLADVEAALIATRD